MIGSNQVQMPRWISKDREEAFRNFAASFPHLVA